MDARTQRLRRILLVRNDRIGDLMLTLPAFAAVRRQWPEAHVTALASAYAGPLLSGCPYLDELLLDDPAESPWKLGKRLKAMRFDAALVFNTNTRNCLAVWRARIRQRVCWAYKPAGMLLGNRRVALHRSHPPVHEAEFSLAFVRRLGASAELADLAPRLEIDAATRQCVAARIERDLGRDGPLFGVHPGNQNSAYNWPQASYSELIGRLARYGRVMVTGGPAERPLLQWIQSQLAQPAGGRIAFYSDFQLPELAAALEQQTALTVSSTGPMHIAGVIGTPVVALFSPHPVHSPQKWAPLGSGHTLLVAPLDPGEDPNIPRERAAEVMGRISVQQALEANLRCAQQASPADTPTRHGRTATSAETTRV